MSKSWRNREKEGGLQGDEGEGDGTAAWAIRAQGSQIMTASQVGLFSVGKREPRKA